MPVFQDAYFPTSRAMLRAVASWHLNGGPGANADRAAELLARSDDDLAEEAIMIFGLNDDPQFMNDFAEEGEVSHMEEERYDAEDLAAAFAEFRQPGGSGAK